MAKINWSKILKTVGGILLSKFLAEQRKKNKTAQQTPKSSSSPKQSSAPKQGSTSQPKSARTQQTSQHSNGGDSSLSDILQERYPTQDQPKKSAQRGKSSPILSETYPGDYEGTVTPEYSPSMDGDADPGEIVWTWVPYEDDYNQGKDRPILLVGHDGPWLLGLMLTSKDKDGSRYGEWLDIGSGPWDSQGRDSEIRLDRLIRIDPSKMRREGAIMPQKLFEKITNAL